MHNCPAPAGASALAAASAAAPSHAAASGAQGGAAALVNPKVYTVAVVRQGSGVVLGWKKRGFGQGRLMGFGGKVEPGETVLQAAIREIREECGVEATGIEKRAEIVFHFQGDPRPWLVHAFDVLDFSGELVESDEMRPQFFERPSIPYDSMFPDDILWLPPFLEGNFLSAVFSVSKDGGELFERHVEVLVSGSHFKHGI